MSKSIINQLSSNGLSTVTTINTPATSTAEEIVIWDGVNESSISGGHGVLINPNGDIQYAGSVTFKPDDTNPGGAATVWVNSGDSKLYLGANPVSGTGDVVGPSSSLDGQLCSFDGTTGKLIKQSSIVETDYATGGKIYAVDLRVPDALGLYPNNNVLCTDFDGGLVAIGTGLRKSVVGSGPSLNSVFVGGQVAVNLQAGDTAYNNVGVGWGAMSAITTGHQNVAVGSQCMSSLADGYDNIAIGMQALQIFNGGSGNIAIGSGAMSSLMTGTNNIVVGGGSNYTGNESENILIGNDGVAGEGQVIRIGAATNQTSCYISGIQNNTSASPSKKLVTVDPDGKLCAQTDSSVSGPGFSYNNGIATFNGTDGKTIKQSGLSMAQHAFGDGKVYGVNFLMPNSTVLYPNNNVLVTDYSNLLVGLGTSIPQTILDTSTPLKSVYIGNGSGSNIDISSNKNVGLGYNALNAQTTGNQNTALGCQANEKLTTGYNNTSVGDVALQNLTTGYNNTAVGTGALNALLTGHDNIVIGAGILSGSNLNGSESTNIIIGNNGTAGDNQTIRLGSDQHTLCYLGGVFGSSSVDGSKKYVTVDTDGKLCGTTNIDAGSLKTTGSSVVVSGAAPPSTSQVLTATGATTAAWSSIYSSESYTGPFIGTVSPFTTFVNGSQFIFTKVGRTVTLYANAVDVASYILTTTVKSAAACMTAAMRPAFNTLFSIYLYNNNLVVSCALYVYSTGFIEFGLAPTSSSTGVRNITFNGNAGWYSFSVSWLVN